MEAGGIVSSWAGGDRGRQVIDKFLPMIPNWLSPSGIFYMVAIAQNDPNNILECLLSLGIQAQVALVASADEEKLSILRGGKMSNKK